VLLLLAVELDSLRELPPPQKNQPPPPLPEDASPLLFWDDVLPLLLPLPLELLESPGMPGETGLTGIAPELFPEVELPFPVPVTSVPPSVEFSAEDTELELELDSMEADPDALLLPEVDSPGFGPDFLLRLILPFFFVDELEVVDMDVEAELLALEEDLFGSVALDILLPLVGAPGKPGLPGIAGMMPVPLPLEEPSPLLLPELLLLPMPGTDFGVSGMGTVLLSIPMLPFPRLLLPTVLPLLVLEVPKKGEVVLVTVEPFEELPLPTKGTVELDAFGASPPPPKNHHPPLLPLLLLVLFVLCVPLLAPLSDCD